MAFDFFFIWAGRRRRTASSGLEKVFQHQREELNVVLVPPLDFGVCSSFLWLFLLLLRFPFHYFYNFLRSTVYCSAFWFCSELNSRRFEIWDSKNFLCVSSSSSHSRASVNTNYGEAGEFRRSKQKRFTSQISFTRFDTHNKSDPMSERDFQLFNIIELKFFAFQICYSRLASIYDYFLPFAMLLIFAL